MKKIEMLIKNGRVSAKNIKEVNELQTAAKELHGVDVEATASNQNFGGWNVKVVM